MRYIDADWIYQMVENRYRVSSGIEHRCERDLLDLICQAPTADVVTKSEVMKVVGEYYDKCDECRVKISTSVAREIFEEIESNIYPMLGLENDKEYVAILRATFAELKKKYTEGEL